VAEADGEIFEDSVTHAVKVVDCDTVRSDDGEKLSYTEVDEEGNADGETLTLAKRVDVTVSHAVIESL